MMRLRKSMPSPLPDLACPGKVEVSHASLETGFSAAPYPPLPAAGGIISITNIINTATLLGFIRLCSLDSRASIRRAELSGPSWGLGFSPDGPSPFSSPILARSLLPVSDCVAQFPSLHSEPSFPDHPGVWDSRLTDHRRSFRLFLPSLPSFSCQHLTTTCSSTVCSTSRRTRDSPSSCHTLLSTSSHPPRPFRSRRLATPTAYHTTRRQSGSLPPREISTPSRPSLILPSPPLPSDIPTSLGPAPLACHLTSYPLSGPPPNPTSTTSARTSPSLASPAPPARISSSPVPARAKQPPPPPSHAHTYDLVYACAKLSTCARSGAAVCLCVCAYLFPRVYVHR
jgi:hypothetical protein